MTDVISEDSSGSGRTHRRRAKVQLDLDSDSDNRDTATVGISSEQDYVPALNFVAMEKVFEVFCEAADLKSCRLVCKVWNDAALHRWRNVMTVTLGKKDSGLDWENVDKLYENCEGRVVKSFKISRCSFESSDAPALEKTVKFFEDFGSHLTRLVIKSVKVDLSVLAKFEKAIFQQLPNLRFLALNKIRCKEDFSGADVKDVAIRRKNLNLTGLEIGGWPFAGFYKDHELYWNIAVGWKQLMFSFPNVELLHFEYISDSSLENLLNALNSAGWKNIRDLKIGRITTRQNRLQNVKTILQHEKMSLRELSINIKDDKNGDLIRHLIDCHGETLLKLELDRSGFDKLGRYAYPNAVLESFQGLSSLTELRIKGIFFENLEFLEYTPNLKLLLLETTNILKLVFNTDLGRRRPIQKLAQLEELRITKCGRKRTTYMSGASMRLLISYMPNVIRFEGPLTNDGFRVMCGKWTRLVELNIRENTINDRGITGILKTKRCANITDLKELRKITITMTPHFPCGEGLGNISILDGFLKLEKLAYLSAPSSAFSRATPETLAELARKVPYTRLE